MIKNPIKAPPVSNPIQGGTATLTLDPGPRYHQIILVATVTKTSPTADAAIEPTLNDVLGLLDLRVDTVSKRQHTAQEINSVQTDLDSTLAAQLFSKMDGSFNSIADTTATNNSVACTTRTSTWVLAINLADPSRDSYAARQLFAWPTQWIKNGNVVKTTNVQLFIGVPGSGTALAAMATGKYFLSNPAIRAELVQDSVSGPFNGDIQQGGNWVSTSASTSVPMMPITHYYRHFEVYSNTTPTIRQWPFTGYLQQMSIFSPSGSGDDVGAFTLLKNSVNVADSYKQTNDIEKLNYGWNLGRINTTDGDAANTNWPSADLFHYACDFDDDPQSALPVGANDTLELRLTLDQNTASNKNLIFLSQVYRDALAS